MKNSTTVVDEILSVLRKDPNILAVALVGSVAQDNADEYSDYDFYVLIDKDKGKKRIQTHVGKKSVDIIFNTVDEAFGYLSAEKGTTHRNTAHLMAHGKLLWGSASLWRKMLVTANKVLSSKIKKDKTAIAMCIYSVDDYLAKSARAAKAGDVLGFVFASRFVVENSLELMLIFKDKYWQPTQRMDALVRSVDPKLHRLLLAFYAEKTIVGSYEVLVKLADHAINVAGGPLPDAWSIKR